MADQQTIERIQQERHSANNDKLYQATLKEVQTKVKDMLKTQSPEQVKQAIYLFFRS